MAGDIPAGQFRAASFNRLIPRLLPFQGAPDEYVEADGAGMLVRQPPRQGGCLASLWNPQRGSGW
jgi:hypothetical protein